MEKSTVDQLLNQLASGQNPVLSQSLEDLLSSEPGGAEALKAYQKEPEKNRGLLENVLSQVLESSDNPILKIILSALQGSSGKQADQEPGQGGLLGEVLETLAENLLDKPKPKPKTRPKSKSKPKTGSSTKSKSKTGTKSKTKSKSKTKTGTKTKPKTKASSKTKTKSKPKTKTAQIDLEE